MYHERLKVEKFCDQWSAQNNICRHPHKLHIVSILTSGASYTQSENFHHSRMICENRGRFTFYDRLTAKLWSDNVVHRYVVNVQFVAMYII